MHDMSYLPKSILIKLAKKQRFVYGEDLQTRFNNCIQQYINNGYKIKSKIYKNADHKSLFANNYTFKDNFLRALYAFYISGNKGTAFLKDDSSADCLDMSYQLQRQENCIKEH